MKSDMKKKSLNKGDQALKFVILRTMKYHFDVVSKLDLIDLRTPSEISERKRCILILEIKKDRVVDQVRFTS